MVSACAFNISFRYHLPELTGLRPLLSSPDLIYLVPISGNDKLFRCALGNSLAHQWMILMAVMHAIHAPIPIVDRELGFIPRPFTQHPTQILRTTTSGFPTTIAHSHHPILRNR